MSEESRAGKSLFDRLGESLGNHDVGLAALARVFGPHVLNDDDRRRHIFELLADLLTEARTLRAAIGTEPLLERDIVHNPPARQIRRQGLAAVAFGRRFRRRGPCGLGRGLGLGLGRWLGLRFGGLEDLSREEQEPVGIELFGFTAIEPPEGLFELMLEIGVEMGLLAEGLDQLADEPVSGLEVVGEWGVEFDRRHTINTDDDRRCD
jgi:hypothetical protein